MYWPRFHIRAAAGQAYVLPIDFSATVEQLMQAPNQGSRCRFTEQAFALLYK
jgi:hypothetical protein